jgi:hypothetical protein
LTINYFSISQQWPWSLRLKTILSKLLISACYILSFLTMFYIILESYHWLEQFSMFSISDLVSVSLTFAKKIPCEVLTKARCTKFDYNIGFLQHFSIFSDSKLEITFGNPVLISGNKRDQMALDRSPQPSNSSEQLPRQASWPSFMTIESKMWPPVFTRLFNIWVVWPSFWPKVNHIRTWPRNHQNKLLDEFQGYFDQNSSH